ncbi:MAG: hypothetical protein KJ697_03440 [Nanoarchaeota archaeon]|nr:hypothetical protein [Nanoarchaeota archaeon]MBU4124172.1 hypothetical protein [Nanoarchaeota archaeon]
MVDYGSNEKRKDKKENTNTSSFFNRMDQTYFGRKRYTDKELLDPKYGKERRKEIKDGRTLQYGEGYKRESDIGKYHHGRNSVASALNSARWRKAASTVSDGTHPSVRPYHHTVGENLDKMDEIAEPRVKHKKTATTAVVTILALFGMYLLSLQGSATAGYAMCLDNGNVLIGGIALIVIILLFVLINTRKVGREIVKYIPVKTAKRKVKSKRRK